MATWNLDSKKIKLDFKLISLLRSENEKNLEEDFKKHIKLTDCNQYLRMNWEDIYEYIVSIPESESKKIICNYFQNKTIGYSSGQLQKAFKITNANMV